MIVSNASSRTKRMMPIPAMVRKTVTNHSDGPTRREDSRTSTELLKQGPELIPRHAHLPAHENIRMIAALLVSHTIRVGIVRSQFAGLEQPVRIVRIPPHHDQRLRLRLRIGSIPQ